MCTLQERLRCVLQRNKPNTQICSCSRVKATQPRYQDERGRMVTLIRKTGQTVIYLRDGYSENCELSSDRFYKKFKRVDV